MAWLTTVNPEGKPDTVPVWYLLRDDETVLIYSRPGKAKLRNIDHNPAVALGLDVTDLGRDVIRLEGTRPAIPKLRPPTRCRRRGEYVERIAAIFGTAGAIRRAVLRSGAHHPGPAPRLAGRRSPGDSSSASTCRRRGVSGRCRDPRSR